MDRQQFILINNLYNECNSYIQEFDEIFQRVDDWTESLKRDVQKLLNKDSTAGPVIPSTPACSRVQRKRLSVICEVADDPCGGTTDGIPHKKNDKIQKKSINCDSCVTTVQYMETDEIEENSSQNEANEVYKHLPFDAKGGKCKERGSERLSKNSVKKAKLSSSCSRSNSNAEEITQYVSTEESSLPVCVDNGEETLKTKRRQKSSRHNEITTEPSLQRNTRASDEATSISKQSLSFPSENVQEVPKTVRKSKRLQKSSLTAAKTLDRRNTRTRRSTRRLDKLVLSLPHSSQNLDKVESSKHHNSFYVNEFATKSSIKSLKQPELLTNGGTLSPAAVLEAEELKKSSQNSQEDCQIVTKSSYQRALSQPVSITEKTITHSVEVIRKSPHSQNKDSTKKSSLGRRNTRTLNKSEIIQASATEKSRCSQKNKEIVSEDSDCSVQINLPLKKSKTDQSSVIDTHSSLNSCRSKESRKTTSKNIMEKDTAAESEETNHNSIEKTKINKIRDFSQMVEFQNRNVNEDNIHSIIYLKDNMQNQKHSLESSSSLAKNLPHKVKTPVGQEDVHCSAVMKKKGDKSSEIVCLETSESCTDCFPVDVSAGKQLVQDSDSGERACRENDFPSKTGDLHVISTGQRKSSNSSENVNTIESEKSFVNESEKSAQPQSVSSVTLMLLQKRGVNITNTSKRITRSKARAIAASGKAVLPVKIMIQKKIVENSRNSARSSIKKAVKCLSSVARKQEASKEIIKSTQKPGVILTNTETFIKKAIKPIETGEKKLLEQKKREEKEKEVARRREEILRKKTEEKKKKLLEKTRQVLHNREVLEKEKQKAQEHVEKEKDVKLNVLIQDKEVKQKHQMFEKQQKLVAEVKQRAEAEAEANRITKQKQETLLRKLLIEEEKRKVLNHVEGNEYTILREKIEQKNKGKALKPVPNIQKPNLNTTFDKTTANLNAESSNSTFTVAEPINNAYYLDDLVSDNSDDEQENAPTKKAARWAKRSTLLKESYYQLEVSSVINNIFLYNKEINISAIFPNKRLKRTSSARWDTPPRYSLLPKY